MLVYFDTEFTGLHKNTTLISLGMIAQNDKRFYAEFTDYDKSQVNDWINENVIDKLKLVKTMDKNTQEILSNILWCVVGDKNFISESIKNWLSSFNSPIQLVSDVCHYDMILFIDLFGTAFDLPEFISPSCHDINQDIANYLNISEQEAFNISRESFLFNINTEDSFKKHNALYDAEIIKECYEKINNK